MRVVLHIGMPKAGSSALQNGLRANKVIMREAGYLYPSGFSLPKNHNLLVTPLVPADQMPRLFRHVYGKDPQRGLDDARLMMMKVRSRARRAGADTVILSGEMLFRPLSPESAQSLRDLLLTVGDQITVVAYVRHPAAYYLSMVQQMLKANAYILPPSGREYRAAMSPFEAVGDDMIVRLYDIDAFDRGDITRDFATHVLGADQNLVSRLKPETANRAMSADAMDAIYRYRKLLPQDNTEFTADGVLVHRLLEAADVAIPGSTRAVLHPHIVEAIVRTCPDIGWLKERWGIAFPGVDYSAVRAAAAPVENIVPQWVGDICTVDATRSAALLAHALHTLAVEKSGPAVTFGTAMPAQKPKPKPPWRHRLYRRLFPR